MLHRLEIENFYSIRDRQIIDLRAPANVQDDDGRLAPLWTGSKERAPKVVALFGANASGKSNVLRALSFIAWFIKDSFAAAPNAALPFERFMSDDFSGAPTYLSFHAVGPENFNEFSAPSAKRCRYAYDLRLGGETSKVVLSENLYYWPSFASRRVKIFERDMKSQVTASQAFGLKDHQRGLQKILRPNASVISTLAQLGHFVSGQLQRAVSTVTTNILTEKGDFSDAAMIEQYNKFPILVERLEQQLQRIDSGIRAVRIEPGVTGPNVSFLHEGLNTLIPLRAESHGTRQFMKLLPLFEYVFANGGIAIIDELDSALHPMMLAEVLRGFYSPERNPRNAQLWMSCHNASILEDLTKEEVFFCEKDHIGQTHIYGLRDIRSRRDDNYYKKYLGGAYGAVPQIG